MDHIKHNNKTGVKKVLYPKYLLVIDANMIIFSYCYIKLQNSPW